MAHTHHAMPLLPFFANSSSSCCSFMVGTSARLQRSIENLHAVNSRNHNRCRQVQGIVQHSIMLQYLTVTKYRLPFHAKNADVLFNQFWHNQLRKVRVMGIHHIERQLSRIKLKPVFCCNFQHMQVNIVFMPSKANVIAAFQLDAPQLRLHSPPFVENSMRIFKRRIS